MQESRGDLVAFGDAVEEGHEGGSFVFQFGFVIVAVKIVVAFGFWFAATGFVAKDTFPHMEHICNVGVGSACSYSCTRGLVGKDGLVAILPGGGGG